jgi:hypothetical protein
MAHCILHVSFSNENLLKWLRMHPDVLFEQFRLRCVRLLDAHERSAAVTRSAYASLNELDPDRVWRGRGRAVQMQKGSLLILLVLSRRALLEVLELLPAALSPRSRLPVSLLEGVAVVVLILSRPMRRLLASEPASRCLGTREIGVSHI